MSNFLEEAYCDGATLSVAQVKDGLRALFGTRIGQVAFDSLIENDCVNVANGDGTRWAIVAVRGGYRVT